MLLSSMPIGLSEYDRSSRAHRFKFQMGSMAMTLPSDEYLRELLPDLLPGINIEKKFASSGQRVVYLATFGNPADQELIAFGRCVLKVSSELSHKQIAYLQKEIEILNSLSSFYYPKLLFNEVYSENPITDTKLGARLFLTIEEHIDSISLQECIKNYGNEKDCILLLLKLIEALSVLWNHKNKLIHRDIKPANILIRPTGDVVIIDLGILREEGSIGLTAVGFPFGPCTPGYGSPEQAVNDKKNISSKSDFFSLGILAYEICAGINPFLDGATSIDEVLERVVNFNPPSLVELGKVSARFSGVIEKLLEKQPYKRYRTIEKLVADISICLGEL